MPGFKASKNKLTPVRVNALMQLVTFKLKSLIIYQSGSLRIMLNQLFLSSGNGPTQPG